MMIYNYTDYRAFLHDFIAQQKNSGWGWRARMARAIGIESTYISQVLVGRCDFSIEQGERISKELKLSNEETEYFIFLILKARAGTQGLKDLFSAKLDSLSRHRQS